MINKDNLDLLIENKEYSKISTLLFNEFKILFQKLTNTQDKDLSFTSLLNLMTQKYPQVSEKLDLLVYLISDTDSKESEKSYNLLNLYINFVKFYSL